MSVRPVGIGFVGNQVDGLVSFVVEAVLREVLALERDTVVNGQKTLGELNPALDAADILQIHLRFSDVFCLPQEELVGNEEISRIHLDFDYWKQIKVADICARLKQVLLRPERAAA